LNPLPQWLRQRASDPECFVVGWSAPIAVAYAVLVTISLVLTPAAYELLVRRTRVTRFLFGMRV
jgi:hypothetical protein